MAKAALVFPHGVPQPGGLPCRGLNPVSKIPVRPLRIKQESPGILRITWDDGKDVALPTEYLRRKCPCASCLQEAEENRSRGMFPLALAGQNTIADIRQSGRNAVIITWGDGHNTGIYTWEYLCRLTTEFTP
jgi:DUF971 family protein